MSTVVVIGGGIAGYCAALSARREGAEVVMLAKAPGATALYAGAMEITGDLDLLLKSEPHHPFNRLRLDAVGLATELDSAIPALMLALAKDGVELVGEWRTRRTYFDVHGLARPGNLVPASVAPGALENLSGKRIRVVGVREVGEYDAESAAHALREMHGVDALPEEVSMPELPTGASLTDLYGRRAPEPGPRGSLRAYPPGFTGLPDGGFELLSSVPSPHGWRLQQAIGLTAVRAEVTQLQAANGRVSAAQTWERAYHGDAFVLATGHHIGGGLRKEHPVREPLAGLGVFHDGMPVSSGGTRLQHLEYLEPAPQFHAGLMTDERLRPLDAAGEIALDNLYAAGTVLGGFDYAGPCGFGVPILTGWLAGRWAARAGR